MTHHKQEDRPRPQRAEATKRKGTTKIEKAEGKLDQAVEQTFPASDPPAPGHATAHERPSRPADRKAPVISKEDVDRARAKGK